MTPKEVQKKNMEEFDKRFGGNWEEISDESKPTPFYAGIRGDKTYERNLYYDVKKHLTTSQTSLLQSIYDEVGKLKKEKTSPRQLYKYDGTVEQIKYYENDSDPAFNQALSEIQKMLKELIK